MSISRENWSALSTLAQQWTMEDEEEVERERRRKTKSSVSDVDPDVFTDDSEPQNTGEDSDYGGGLEKLQLDFMEMLRERDEHRRQRHVETLNRQRQEVQNGSKVGGEENERGEEEIRVEAQGDMQKCLEAPVSSPTASGDPTAQSYSVYNLVSETGPQRENGSTGADYDFDTQKSPRTFVSSVSISFDKNVANTRVASPTSAPSQDYQSSGPADKPAFTRQSSRTRSFRILKKKEEESMPFQRSASLRITAKKFEPNQGSNDEVEQQSPFSRNSRHRLSSRTIQEKMERLTQASQKWEAVKSPTISHKTLCLVDEVSRKRELFEREQATSKSPAPKKLDYRTLSAGISSQVNRLIQKKSLQSLSSLTSTDLRHVDISSKKMLFEEGKPPSSSSSVHPVN